MYVESNFVLEAARRQEESVHVDALLALAESGAISLAFPAFAVAEPFSVARRAGADRNRLAAFLRDSVHELGRSAPYRALAGVLHPAVASLLRIEREETDRLERTIARMLNAGTCIDLDRSVFDEAGSFARGVGLPLPDAIMFACVLRHLRLADPSAHKCFVSTNSKDFDQPMLRAELARFGCRYIARFADTLAFVRHAPPGEGPTPGA